MELNTNVRLRLNPALVAWPGETLRFAFAEADGTLGPPLHVPPEAINVLSAFREPKSVGEVVESVTAEILDIIGAAVEGGFLVTARFAETSERYSLKYEGFRLKDRPPGICPSMLARKTVRHVKAAGKSVFVIDEWLPNAARISCLRWVMQLPYRLRDVDSIDSRQYRHWISVFSPPADYAEAVPILRHLALLGMACFRARSLSVSRAHAYCVAAGDIQHAHRDFEDGAGITIVYFANVHWHRSWGSEMLFYGRGGEAEAAIQPKPGRIVAFRGDIEHRAGVPFANAGQPRYTIVLRLAGSGPAPAD